MRIMAWVTGRPQRVIKSRAEPDDDAYPELKHALQLGRCTRDLRERNGLSQHQLARAAGMQVESVERFEAGAYLPSLPVLERVAKALGVSLDIRLR
jgi:ribosome-binding protein aMBF1 (putative translation factor)